MKRGEGGPLYSQGQRPQEKPPWGTCILDLPPPSLEAVVCVQLHCSIWQPQPARTGWPHAGGPPQGTSSGQPAGLESSLPLPAPREQACPSSGAPFTNLHKGPVCKKAPQYVNYKMHFWTPAQRCPEAKLT